MKNCLNPEAGIIGSALVVDKTFSANLILFIATVIRSFASHYQWQFKVRPEFVMAR